MKNAQVNFFDVLAGDGKLLVTGSGGRVYRYDRPCENWTPVDAGKGALHGIAEDESTLVVVGASGRVYERLPGEGWTQSPRGRGRFTGRDARRHGHRSGRWRGHHRTMSGSHTYERTTRRTRTRELYWYVLAAYLLAVGSGIAGFLALVALTNKLTIISVGAIAILVVLSLLSLATFPALYRDAAYLRTTTEWKPTWWLYVVGGGVTPIIGYFTGGALFGPRINLLLSVLSWVGSVSSMCVVYLYRRHAAVGVRDRLRADLTKSGLRVLSDTKNRQHDRNEVPYNVESRPIQHGRTDFHTTPTPLDPRQRKHVVAARYLP
ncbi:hypothetical protein A4G99_20455 [Haladaptatus sp. R4]|nr:hypothetical protein A4G99_20455 [Haladaptatus sp. R4]